MMRWLPSTTVFAMFLVAASGSAAWAQAQCPKEVGEAEKLLVAIKAPARPPASAAGHRVQAAQAPRSQDVQAPRSQDVQAPRSQDVQAPRTQDVQAPRAQAPGGTAAAMQARRSAIDNATRLVREARKACDASDMRRAEANARAALELLHYLQ